MFFNFNERFIILRKYTNNDNNKIINIIDKHSTLIYFNIKINNKYFVNV